ncbi:MAG: DNA translocase FtsK 4TM domain-containing protein, partial [Alphaproteobacteria bacterium]|nr:DNA translocase FtsK 4TM domain-containing protein [Alphaproteobacteria bacterium]
MARTSSETGKTRFLPASVSGFLRRRAIETAGLVVMAAGVALVAAVLSFSPNDPSLNKAVDGPIANFMGSMGAIVADLGLQSIGAGAILPGLILLSWGYRVAAGKQIGALWLRVAILPLALLLVAAGVAGIAPPEGWSLRAGLGGYLGQFALGELHGLVTKTGLQVDFLALSLPIGFIGVAALIYVFGFSFSEWRSGGQFALRGAKASGRAASRGAAASFSAGKGITSTIQRQFSARKPRLEPRIPELRVTPGHQAVTPEAPGRADSTFTPRTQENTAADDLVAPRTARTRPGRRASAARQTTLNLVPDGDFELPSLDLLELPIVADKGIEQSKESLEANAKLLMGVLQDFGVHGDILKVRPGPVVTLYELEPAPGIKSSRVIGLADDIARSMSAVSVRIAVVPGRNVIGIELPNAQRETVYLRELLASESYERTSSKLTLVLGKDISGAPIMADLSRMPHLLIAGTTGSGKSVAINTMILSLIYRLTPDECRFIMIDPKMLELSVYDDIPHLLAPVVTEPGKAVMALRWTVKEMENRYRNMSELGVRNIASYNQRLAETRRKGKHLTRKVQTGFDPDTGKPMIEEHELDLKPLPLI